MQEMVGSVYLMLAKGGAEKEQSSALQQKCNKVYRPD